MKRITAVLMLLAGCASQPQDAPDIDASGAVDDFVEINELQSVNEARTNRRYDIEYVTDRYVIIDTGNATYLAELVRRCPALTDVHAYAQADIRRNVNALRAGADTIKGCRIKTIYELDETQVLELKEIGEAPGERRTKTG